MSVTDSSPPHPRTSTTLALTAPAHTHRESVGDRVRSGMEADGGVDGGSADHDLESEDVLSKITEVNNHLVQIGYTNHLIVLASVGILNEADVRPVKTGHILEVANRMTTETEFSRPNIENSLKKLYGGPEEVGFVDRDGPDGNAYDWFVTEKGRTAMALLYELGIIEMLAESGLTAGID